MASTVLDVIPYTHQASHQLIPDSFLVFHRVEFAAVLNPPVAMVQVYVFSVWQVIIGEFSGKAWGRERYRHSDVFGHPHERGTHRPVIRPLCMGFAVLVRPFSSMAPLCSRLNRQPPITSAVHEKPPANDEAVLGGLASSLDMLDL